MSSQAVQETVESQTVKKLLKKHQAVITGGHFVCANDDHSSAYVDKYVIYPHTADTSFLCRLIAERFAGEEVQVVVGPAKGGIILSHLVAQHLSEITKREVLAIFAEKDENKKGDFVFRSEYGKLVHGKAVLVVEDTLTTGGTAKKVIELVRSSGAPVVGLGAICSRGVVTRSDLANVWRLEILLDVELETWKEEECPLCLRGVPINTQFGHGRAFLDRKNAEDAAET